MCRLLAFSFRENTHKQNRLDLLDSFRELACTGIVPRGLPLGHHDGWGLSVYSQKEDGPISYKSVSSALHDEDFIPSEFIKDEISQSGLVHLRKKSVGEKSILNTHPFVEGEFSFIHNGTVEKGDGPYKELSSLCVGETDSEKLFRKFLSLQKERSTLDAYVEMLATTKELYPTFSALNTILHDGKYVYVSRVVNTENPLYISFGLENYYTLYIGASKEGDLVVSSEKCAYKDITYSLLPNNSVCVIEVATGAQTLIAL